MISVQMRGEALCLKWIQLDADELRCLVQGVKNRSACRTLQVSRAGLNTRSIDVFKRQ